ncbi:cytochrome c nitrite reductase small subunit [Acanthopleuribacter pedis]|uniref:Cytochrome c nitrite reductase small subunit n=1 Tax=Acanthopleuribacter pedis TaxID=442870 RepID=A0A8J7U7M2_9BACT|nr:cytochrome c nitrite reductase small subunit [Acanthopleuribacter pedis]MBO1322678.1 cytochrome c nitrite reductase small subunit [Acanthopleuribacter pedis]
MDASDKRLRLLLLVTVFVAGTSLGIGVATFEYAEGTSYFSKDPEACVNCHIMRPQYDSWLKSSHRSAATCVDCHLPHEGLAKYLAKAENGWNHSKAFTLQNFKEPIQINEKNSRTLQQNCLSCHAALTHGMTASQAFPDAEAPKPGQFSCVHCHQDVGHGERATMGVLDSYPGRAGLQQLRKSLKNQ